MPSSPARLALTASLGLLGASCHTHRAVPLAVDAGKSAVRPDPETTHACGSISVIDENRVIFAFDPRRGTFHAGAKVACALDLSGPRSIAVDPQGTLWAASAGGGVTRIDPADGRCTPTSLAAHTEGFESLNLTFVGGDAAPVLFAADDHGWGGDVARSDGLATIDMASWKLRPLGQPSAHYAGSAMTLAGTGDGRLYAELSGGLLASLNPASLAVTVLSDHELSKGPGAPMAYFDGALWLFRGAGGLYAPGAPAPPAAQAAVLRFDLASHTLDPIAPTDGRTYAAAGAASCGEAIARDR